MDIEQLKLILETLDAAGTGASKLAIFWMVLNFLSSIATPIAATTVFVVLIKAARRVIAGMNFGDKVAEVLGRDAQYAPDRREMLRKIHGMDNPE